MPSWSLARATVRHKDDDRSAGVTLLFPPWLHGCRSVWSAIQSWGASGRGRVPLHAFG